MMLINLSMISRLNASAATGEGIICVWRDAEYMDSSKVKGLFGLFYDSFRGAGLLFLSVTWDYFILLIFEPMLRLALNLYDCYSIIFSRCIAFCSFNYFFLSSNYFFLASMSLISCSFCGNKWLINTGMTDL